MQSIDWQTVDGYQLAYIDTSLAASRSHGMNGDMVLQPIPPQATPPHEAVFVGELRLAHLKDFLAKSGYQVSPLLYSFKACICISCTSLQTEFAAGVLVVNGVVMLKKVPNTAFQIEIR